MVVSTHSRPKAAGAGLASVSNRFWFQLTAARRRLEAVRKGCFLRWWFQLTAARRRLGGAVSDGTHRLPVSTHSRPKAAGWPSWPY